MMPTLTSEKSTPSCGQGKEVPVAGEADLLVPLDGHVLAPVVQVHDVSERLASVVQVAVDVVGVGRGYPNLHDAHGEDGVERPLGHAAVEVDLLEGTVSSSGIPLV